MCRRCLQAYYSYSLIIMGMTLFSIITNVASAYRYRRRLAALAHYTCEVQVRCTYMRMGGGARAGCATGQLQGALIRLKQVHIVHFTGLSSTALGG